MNENINLCELLKGHKGETFYSPAFGYMTLNSVSTLLWFKLSNGKFIELCYNGKYIDEGEVCIFPSKNQRDWNKWAEEHKTMKLSDIKDKVDKWFESKTPEEVYNILKKYGAIEEENEEQKPKIPKTWSELVEQEKVKFYEANLSNNDELINEYSPIEKAALALLKIHQLIEVGYGGNITAEQWLNPNIQKYVVIVRMNNLTEDEYTLQREVVAFHTKEQRNEFLSYPENVQLIKDLYMDESKVIQS